MMYNLLKKKQRKSPNKRVKTICMIERNYRNILRNPLNIAQGGKRSPTEKDTKNFTPPFD